MMKSVFALVVLLHLCYTAELDMNVNEEIQNGLAKLAKRKHIIYTTLDFVTVPTLNNTHNTSLSSCVGKFTKLLKELLDSMTGNDDLLRELKENLKHLRPHGETDHNCGTDRIKRGPKVFKKFINFLQKLNDAM